VIAVGQILVHVKMMMDHAAGDVVVQLQHHHQGLKNIVTQKGDVIVIANGQIPVHVKKMMDHVARHAVVDQNQGLRHHQGLKLKVFHVR